MKDRLLIIMFTNDMERNGNLINIIILWRKRCDRIHVLLLAKTCNFDA